MSNLRRRFARTATTVLPALIVALTVALLVPVTAGAATYLLRPANTTAVQSGWSVTPSTSTADAVLNKAVTQPALPVTTSYLTAGTGSANNSAGVGVSPAPAFQTGETLKSTTAWAYLSTAPSQTLAMSLQRWLGFFGYQSVGSVTIPAGSPAGWYSVPAQSPLDSGDLHNLSVNFVPGGTGSGSRVYAAYVQVDTNDPPPVPSAPTPAPPASPSVPAPVSAPAVPGLPSGARTGVSLGAPVVKLAPGATSIQVSVSCAPGTPHGCTGQLVLTLPAAPTAKHASASRVRAVAARCARGCRVLGHSNFSIAAGTTKKVKVHLAHSASRLFHGRHSIDLLATTTTHDGAGHTQTSTATLTVNQAAPRPKAGSGPGSRRHRKAPHGRGQGGSGSPKGGSQPSSNTNSTDAPASGVRGKGPSAKNGSSSGGRNPGPSHGRGRRR